AALEVERHERRDIGGMLPGLARGELSPEHPDDLATLEQGQIERQPRDSGGKADDEITSLPPDRAQRRFRVVAPHRIEDHLRAIRTAGGPELIGERARRDLVERSRGGL